MAQNRIVLTGFWVLFEEKISMRNIGQPKVSVVITSYNYEAYLEDAIESVSSQTYKNIELIIIDDGSQDNTGIVLKKYANNKNITIVSRENRGVIYTRNEGVRLANGEYIMQLDADDTIDRTYISRCIEKILAEGLDLVYTQAKVFGRVDYQTEFIEYDLEKLKHDNFMHASALVRKSRLKENPYDEYLDKLGNEDWDLFLDLCLDGAKAGLVNEPLLNYRKHTDRKSRADSFEGLYNETLVRHHIWEKQNAKHPDQFWYFSSQIDLLLSVINLHNEFQGSVAKVSQLEQENERLKQIEKTHPRIVARKVMHKITYRK